MTRQFELEGWTQQKIWTCFDIVNGATPASGTTHFWDGDISWVGPADLGKLTARDIYYGEKNLTLSGYKSCGTTLVPKGTIILSARAPIGHVAVAGKELCFNQGCKGLRLKDDVEQNFAYWLILSLKVRLESAGQGTTFVELSRSKLKDIDFFLPPLHEQRAIAVFLDKKCAAIDEAVRIKQAQITFLQERRQILIQQAVTRGLNPNAPMKDSGIDWIGQIPAHWDTRRVKYAAHMKTNKASGSESALRYIGMENVESWPGSILEGDNEADGLATVFREGDVLFGKLRPYLAKVTRPNFSGLCSSEFLVFEASNNICGDYLTYALRSSGFIDLVDGSTYGAKMPRANPSFITNSEIPLPPFSEQRAIAAFLDRECAEVGKAVSLKQSQITALKEYKTVLINAAVTGKIKVT